MENNMNTRVMQGLYENESPANNFPHQHYMRFFYCYGISLLGTLHVRVGGGF